MAKTYRQSRLRGTSGMASASDIASKISASPRTPDVAAVGNPTQDEQVCQHIYDICRVELALYPDCQTFAAVLIQNVQRSEDLSVVGPLVDKIIRPDVVAVLWPQSYA